jgi:ergothioneine biosynthesis protein EgtB
MARDLAFDPLANLAGAYRQVRAATECLAARLSPEDQTIQSMPDASPVRWHRAHTTWFFETFILERFQKGFRPFRPGFRELFNSYYEAVGERHARPLRGVLSRPGNAEVAEWRSVVDDQLLQFLADAPVEVQRLVTLGLHHEQQHQELMLTDIKHAFSLNELRPVYAERETDRASDPTPLRWVDIADGLHEIGHGGRDFAYDNELPPHRVFLRRASVASRPVTNGEYREFIADGGYRKSALWLSDGWAAVQRHGWTAPLYWEGASSFTLAGMRPLVPAEPVCHLSFYEADAFARWAGARLPTEAEWELVSVTDDGRGTWAEAERFHPAPCGAGPHFLGDVWQWTRSSYEPYPGYQPWAGVVGEYNGKFMSGQQVLRGGSCATPRTHLRRSYRNFFPPEARWQFSGVRLARDI